MPENQNPYLDPNMNPGAAAPYGNGYPGAMPPEYADPSMAYGAPAQPDMQGGWGAPYGAQADPQAFGSQGYAGMPPMDGGAMPGQDPYAQQGFGQAPMAADAGYYGGAQYAGYGDQGAAYGEPLYQTGAAPYQADPYGQQGQVQGQGGYYGQPDAGGAAPGTQPMGATQTDFAAWQYGQDGAGAPMPQQAYQPQQAYGQQPQPEAQPAPAAAPEAAAQQPYAQPAPAAAYDEYSPYNDPNVVVTPIDPTYPTGGRAVRCLIFGILSIVFALIPPVGIVFAVVTIRSSKKYLLNGGTDGKAEAGRIFGIAGLVFSVLMLAFVIGFVCFMVGALTANSVARDLILYFNASPLGSLITIPI